MMNQHDIQPSAKPANAKRVLLAKPLMIAAASLALSAVALPAAASTWWNASPSISIGTRTINVKTKGALGNGQHDDTAAFQAAIDSLPSSGGTVYVPAGHYMINATKAIHLRSHTRVQMDPSATLEVIPTTSSHYWIFKIFGVNNVRIDGGSLVGDRARHKGSTGEWGFGIDIQGSQHVLVKDTRLSNFWGDGMWIGATGRGSTLNRSDYVTINHIVSSNNRRQGLSIGPAKHVYIVNSTFQNTRGTLPEAGIDIEPQDQGPADTVRLEKNTFSGNHGNGIELHANIKNIAIVSNTLSGNNGFGALAVSSAYLTISNNYATRNGLAGVGLAGTTHNSAVRDNRLQYNSTHYMSPSRSGGANDRDIQFGRNTYANTSSNNQLTPR